MNAHAPLGRGPMTAAMLSPAAYHAPGIFAAELNNIFGKGYQFVAMTDELANDRDFVCVQHAGASLVVQNFKGELRAFINVCSHRFKRIHDEVRGNRSLTCMYHGWTYDRSGYPAGLPKRAQYERDGQRDANLYLTVHEVATCGKFVFVKSAGSMTLREQLGSFHDVLEELSRHIGAQIHFGDISTRANWKLLVENVVECYHCVVIHQETFLASGYGKASADDIVIEGGNSSFHLPRLDARDEATRKRFLSHLKNRSLSHDSFHHIHVFPNLFVASTEGMHFYVGHALPISPTESLLRVRYYEPAHPFASWKRGRQDMLNAETTAIGLRLIDEDRTILESIQHGVQFADKAGVLGEEEVRIRGFQDHYRAMMAMDGLPGPFSGLRGEQGDPGLLHGPD